ncbi:MAG: serine/threonine protein kinase [Acidimicrobiia bacterium]|nr:serine/threonine protein kinase [Acidimicrobiia bacterium]
MSKTFALDGFEPIKRIGGGGFGDVWLARQTNVDRKVAVKVGHAPIQDEIIRLRFERECKALGRLSGHPNIVDVYTAGSLDDGRPYLVLEYIDGGTLWQRLKRAPLNEGELISVGEQLAGALAEAHSSGVLHRDLKPENILMRSSGDAVLGDFGIARLQDGVNTTSAAITASVAYAAPEVLGGTKASAASDLYGIGVCLLAAILRSVPFVDKGDKSIHPIISRVMADEPPDLRNHGVSADLAKVVESLLHKDPARRPDSAIEVQNMFHSLRGRPWPSSQGLVDPARHTGAARTDARAEKAEIEPSHESTGNDPDRQARPGPADRAGGRSGRSVPSDDSLPSGRPKLRSESPLGSRQQPPALRANRPSAVPGLSTPDRRPVTDKSADSASNVRAFAIAYVATLSVGAMVIYILAQILG